MRLNVRAAGTALVAGAMMSIAAAPAGAATTKPSLAHVVREAHGADSALTQVRKLASHDSAAARHALARQEADIAAAAHQARWLHSRGAVATSASAFGAVAAQYDRDVQTYATLIKSTSGSLRTELAKALTPALAGRTEALGFLGQLSGTSVANAKAATTTLSGVIGNAPTQIQSLTGLMNLGGLPPQIQGLIAQAIATAGGSLDAIVTELEGMIPSLPAQVQPIAQQILTQLQGALGQANTSLTGTSSTFGGLLGGTFGSMLGQVTSILQQLIGNIPFIGGILGGTTTGGTTGTGGLGGILGGSTGTGGLGGILGGSAGTGGLGGILGGTGGGFLSGLLGGLGGAGTPGTSTGTGAGIGLPFGGILTSLLGTLGLSLPGL